MKKLILSLAIAVITAMPAWSFDIKDALKGIGSKDKDGGSSALENITGALGNLLSTDKLELSSLTGTWKYSAPAVNFKSDNLLKKAGGAAASKAITDKLSPAYRIAGLDKMTLTVNADNTFSMKVRGITLKGTITTPETDNSNANFVFNFNVAGKIKLGKMDTYITKSATGALSIMFDVSKLISLMEKVSSATNIKSLKSASSLLSGYDGLCAGFEMKK